MLRDNPKVGNKLSDDLKAINTFIIMLIITIMVGAPLIGLSLGIAVKWFEWASK